MTIFGKSEDFAAVQRILLEALDRTETRLLAYCVMPNHWHLVVWPREDGELFRFTHLVDADVHAALARSSAQRGQRACLRERFKSFPVQEDDHFCAVCRYVERNARRANLVQNAEDWQWGSLYRWKHGTAKEKSLLTAWPHARPQGRPKKRPETVPDTFSRAIELPCERGLA